MNNGSSDSVCPPADPQLLARINATVQERVNGLEQDYRRDIAAWDNALQAERNAKNTLQGELDSLRAQLLAVQVSRYVV